LSVSRKQLSQELGKTERTLRYWEKKGLIKSSRTPEDGRVAEYTESEYKKAVAHAIINRPRKPIQFILSNSSLKVMYDDGSLGIIPRLDIKK
jgi:DNA-binding MarR family transcriptional regulator